MNIVKLTQMVVMAFIASVLIYDVYAVFQGGTTATVSYTVRVWASEYVAFTFGIGFIMGHLFWPLRTTPQAEKLKLRIIELEALIIEKES